CLTAKSLWVISIRTAVPRTTDGVPSEADYRNGRLVNKAQICLNGDRSPKWRRSASLARVSNGVVPPSEPVDITPKRIFRDHPGRVRRPEYNADSTDEALAFDHRAGFQDPFFPPNLEGIFGGAHDLGHCDRGGAPSDFREGTFITGIIIEHLGSAGSHMIER